MVLLGLLEALSAALLPVDTTMQPHERVLIEEPLCRFIERNADRVETLAALTDPICIIAGMGLWATRIVRESRAARPEKPKPNKGAQPNANGQGEPAEPTAFHSGLTIGNDALSGLQHGPA